MIGGMLGETTDGSTRTRLLFIENALEVFKSNPIFGVGIDGFRYENHYQFTYSHNNYTELLANLGITGLVLYYSIFVVYLKKSLLTIRNNALPFAILAAMLVTDWSAVSYSSESKMIWMALLMLPVIFNELKIEDSTELVQNGNVNYRRLL